MNTAAPSVCPGIETVHASRAARRRARLFGGSAGLLVLEMVAVRLAVEFDIGWVAAIPVLIVNTAIVRRSPPLAGASLLFGWPVFSLIDLPGMTAGAEHLPFLSILTAWTLVALWYRRLRDGTLRSLRQPVVLGYVSTLLVFIGIGIGAAWSSDVLVNPVLRFLNWDIARSWLGFLVLGLLSVRGLADIKALYAGLPLAFLAFPLSLPVEVWRDFISFRISLGSSMNVGLGFGALNTNTLGQAAGLAAVASAALFLAAPGLRRRSWFVLGFGFSAAIAVATFSRQALLGVVFGVIAAGMATSRRRGIFLVTVTAGVTVVLTLLLVFVVPGSYGFRTRLLEIGESPARGESASAEYRIEETKESLEQWVSAPVFGVGFGGQRFDRVLALLGPSTSESDNDVSFSLRGAHNLAVSVLAQTGIAGFMLLLAFLVGILRRFLRLCRREDLVWGSPGREARVATWAAVVFLFVVQMISGGVGMGSAAMIFLWAAMLATLGRHQAEVRAGGGRSGHA